MNVTGINESSLQNTKRYHHLNSYQLRRFIYRDADTTLARPGRKQATATKL